jgi:hypothetical protein
VLRGVNVENREWQWAGNPTIGFERNAIPVATGAPPDGWGAKIILIAFASGPVNRNDQLYLSFMDEIIAIAKAKGAYTMLAYRYDEPNDQQVEMPDQAAEDAFARLAQRYSEEPAVLYALQVEPHNVSWSQLKPRFTTMVDAIRAHSPQALIAVPGTQWSRYIYHALTDPIARPNLVYKTHPYDDFATVRTVYRLDEVAAVYPVVIGEFGFNGGLGDTERLLDFAEEEGISWVAWLFHEVGCPCALADAETFAPTDYGVIIKAHLQEAAGVLP